MLSSIVSISRIICSFIVCSPFCYGPVDLARYILSKGRPPAGGADPHLKCLKHLSKLTPEKVSIYAGLRVGLRLFNTPLRLFNTPLRLFNTPLRLFNTPFLTYFTDVLTSRQWYHSRPTSSSAFFSRAFIIAFSFASAIFFLRFSLAFSLSSCFG